VKKRTWALVFVIVYMTVLVGLLMTHVQLIVGIVERRMAMVEIVLLVFPVFSISMLLSRWQNAEPCAPEEEKQSVSEKAAVYEYDIFAELVTADDLSEREKEVAWLIYRGFTNRQIAEELFIAETTVKKHVSHIFEKSGVSGRKELKEKWRTKKKHP